MSLRYKMPSQTGVKECERNLKEKINKGKNVKTGGKQEDNQSGFQETAGVGVSVPLRLIRLP